ncbi:MAG: hypothetical protein M3456_15025 [Actinomycetota bacterium]|nr:hypothetical protein [Actinomycetota bacterium]
MNDYLPADHQLAIRSDTPDSDRRGIRHDPIIKELAMTCWFEANGNAEKAARMVAQECRTDQTGHLPQEARLLPSSNAIRRWANTDGWGDQLTQHIGQHYKHLLARYTGVTPVWWTSGC